MNRQSLIDKYNVPVPRYTSYPPANFFGDFTEEAYRAAVRQSNSARDRHLSFYLHIPYCRQLCHYCACNSYVMGSSSAVESYVATLHREMDLLLPLLAADRQIAQIHYGGGTPTILPPDVLSALNRHLLTAFAPIADPEVAIECHPGYLSLADWRALAGAGFTRVSIGVQDFDERVLATVGRRPSQEPLAGVFAVLRDAGVKVSLDFLYGLPGQSVDSFRRTIGQAVDLGPDRLVLFSYAHVPWLKPRQKVLEKAGLPASGVKEQLFDAAAQLLLDAGYVRVGMDHFVRPGDELCAALGDGRLHRNFQGYCTRRTTAQVYAFGVTGISQLESAYVQNTKDIAAYTADVAAGRLPVRRGYALSPREQLVRQVIDTLMCNYTVTLSDEQRRAVNYDEQQLLAMQADGIITLSGSTISMTHPSSPFVRNVAALLDPLMQHTTKSFSKPI